MLSLELSGSLSSWEGYFKSLFFNCDGPMAEGTFWG